MDLLDQAGETLIPSIQEVFKVYNPQPLSAEETLKVCRMANLAYPPLSTGLVSRSNLAVRRRDR